jgi:hypothetical protein
MRFRNTETKVAQVDRFFAALALVGNNIFDSGFFKRKKYKFIL